VGITKLNQHVYINSYNVVSSLGSDARKSFRALLDGKSNPLKIGQNIGFKVHEKVEELLNSTIDPKLHYADRSLQLLEVCLGGLSFSDMSMDPTRAGVIVASSRGASELLEKSYRKFFAGEKLMAKTSPYTTSGVFSSYLAQKLGFTGGGFSLSSACTSSLNAIGTAYHLIKSGLFDSCLVGGTEAPLTPFTMEILNRTGVTNKVESPFPLRSLGESEGIKKGMVLGEGSGLVFLSTKPNKFTFARIKAFQMSGESSGLTGLSADGRALSRAIIKIIEDVGVEASQIDIICAHGSGTEKGDSAEINAYKSVFKEKMPPILLSKWATGHTLGAAGVMSLCFAIETLRAGILPNVPYNFFQKNILPSKEPRTALITGLGFGGGASALLIEKV